MYKSSTLLSLSATLLFSLVFSGVGHAFQIEMKQDVRTLTAAKQVSNASSPCNEGGKGRTGAPGMKRCALESGKQATAGAPYTRTTMLR